MMVAAGRDQRLGNVHLLLVEYAEARRRYEQALPLYQQIGAKVGEANAHTGLGDLARANQEWETAQSEYGLALTIYRQIAARVGQTYVAGHLSEVLAALGQKAQALALLEEGEQIALGIDDQPNLQWLRDKLQALRSAG
jgi:tetratricopeptide (TPR) repeat protein